MLNPVLRREARTSLRNWKMYSALTLYALLIAVAAGLYIYSTMFNSYDYSFDPQSMTGLYVMLSCMQFALICIITPALTAGSISGEREKQTLDLLLITKMSPLSIVLGKLFSSMGIVLLMTITTLPVFAVVFYFGGVSIINLLVITVFLFSIVFTIGSISIFFSTIFKKTSASIALVYLVLFVLGIGTLILYMTYSTFYWNIHGMSPNEGTAVLILIANPGIAFLSILDAQIGTGILADYYIGTGSATYMIQHFWLFNGICNALMSAFFIFLATKYINPSRRGKRK